jgi:hypothetical protein
MSTQLGGCSRQAQTPPPPAAADAGPNLGPKVEFTDASFDALYPFLLRKIAPGPKSALWQRYVGKWVRWTGTLVSFTANGLTFKQLPQTVTFDVSLWLEADQRAGLRRRLQLGDRITYVGRLDSYDDVFRTLYLVHGQILANLGHPDGGQK